MNGFHELGDAVVNIFHGAAASVSHVSQHVNPAVNAAVLALLSDMPQLGVQHHVGDVGSQALAAVADIAKSFSRG